MRLINYTLLLTSFAILSSCRQDTTEEIPNVTNEKRDHSRFLMKAVNDTIENQILYPSDTTVISPTDPIKPPK